jgi:hypothetical protein
MRKHNGMRPQDIVILLKIIANGTVAWQNKDLASELYISPSEISESLNRSLIAGLINAEKTKVHRQSFLEFIEYGFHYVFPAAPGSLVNGLPTAHSHPFMKSHFSSELGYVWPYVNGKARGLAIEPLYPDVPLAAMQDEALYKMLALTDVLRVGKAREIILAKKELKKIIEHEPQGKHHANKSGI